MYSKSYKEIVCLQKVVCTGRATFKQIQRYQYLKWKVLSLDELMRFFREVLDLNKSEVRAIIR